MIFSWIGFRSPQGDLETGQSSTIQLSGNVHRLPRVQSLEFEKEEVVTNCDYVWPAKIRLIKISKLLCILVPLR